MFLLWDVWLPVNLYFAVENIENYFPIPAEHMPKSDAFILEIHGESMINAGILDGDYVLVQSQHTADNGNMVVALIDDSATVKTFYKERTDITDCSPKMMRWIPSS